MPEKIKSEGSSLNTLGLSHQFISAFVKEGDLVIDATAGRGRDTVFLARLVGKSGKVISFDIQPDAVDSTKKLLADSALSDRAGVFLDDHKNLLNYVKEESVSAVMFNLGWLPGGDHSVFSRPESTVPAIEAAMRAIKPGGAISVCMYRGKECGYAEINALTSFFKSVDSKVFTVCMADFVNRTGDFPIPVFIIKST